MKRFIIAFLLASGLATAAGLVKNSDVATSAAIALSKLAALNANSVVVTNGSGFMSASAITTTKLNYLANLGGDLQASLDGKQPLDADLTSLAGNSTDGFWAHIGVGSGIARSLAVGSSKLSISNPSGIAGNPAYDVVEANLTLSNMGASAATVAQLTPACQTISAVDIDWSLSNCFKKTLSANAVFTFSNVRDGQTTVFHITNTASNYIVSWPTVSWPGGTTPTQTVGAKTDVITCTSDGSTTRCNSLQNF